MKRNKKQKEILHKNEKYKLEQIKGVPFKFPFKLKEYTKNWITNEKPKLKPIQKGTSLNKIKNKSQSTNDMY